MSRHIENFNEEINFLEGWDYYYHPGRVKVINDLNYLFDRKDYYEKDYLKDRSLGCELLYKYITNIENFIIFDYIDNSDVVSKTYMLIELLINGIYINDIDSIDDIYSIETEDYLQDVDDPATQLLALILRIEQGIEEYDEWKPNQLNSIERFIEALNYFKEKLLVKTFELEDAYCKIDRKKDIADFEKKKYDCVYSKNIENQIDEEFEFIEDLKSKCADYSDNLYIQWLYEQIDTIDSTEIKEDIESDLNISFDENAQKLSKKRENDKINKRNSRKNKKVLTDNNKLKEELKEKILSLYEAGLTKSDIAKKLNISRSKVIRLLKEILQPVQK